jgi:hypothetical protein
MSSMTEVVRLYWARGRPKRHRDDAGEVVKYEDQYRLCYLRGPEGIIVALAEPLS